MPMQQITCTYQCRRFNVQPQLPIPTKYYGKTVNGAMLTTLNEYAFEYVWYIMYK